MEQYKKDFIEFLLSANALKTGGEWSLKSKRLSPYFFNLGDLNDGVTTGKIAEAYAAALHASGIPFDSIYGIPEKGVGLVGPVSVKLAEKHGDNKPWFFTRKMEKKHGEASNLSPAEKMKAQIVGRPPRAGEGIAQLDDVFTAGDAKYQARKDIAEFGEFKLPVLAIALDRQEVGIDGVSAIEKYEADTKTKVVSIVNSSEVLAHLQLRSETDRTTLRHIEHYLRVYGTKAARSQFAPLEQCVIAAERSIIPACDIPTIEQFEEIVKQTESVKGIGGYKIGFELGLTYGLPKVVDVARKHTSKPIIYDHQKAGSDIPDTGKNFAPVCKNAGIDTVIFFPQAGPETERAWIYHALNEGLNVIVGGRMTHPAYAVSEGGFITDEGALEMYRIAARAGVSNFVVPGNKEDVIKQVRELVEGEGVTPTFYAPGFVAQGGKIENATKVAGDRWHAIVGRGITQAPGQDYRKAAEELTSKL